MISTLRYPTLFSRSSEYAARSKPPLGLARATFSGMRSKPLSGIRVLDLTRLLPGPMATLHLADMGADVVKIEDTESGDYARAMGPARGRSSVFFQLINRNKRAIRLDLKQQQGREVLLRLAKGAEILVEGFRPGAMVKLGVGDQIGTEEAPVVPNFQIADLLGGALTPVMGILAALIDARSSGRGRHVDVAMT